MIGLAVTAASMLRCVYNRDCFVAIKPFCWEHGRKAIEEFKVGERVWSCRKFDPAGPLYLKTIDELFVHQVLVVDLNLVVAGRTIGTTAEHPFYVQGHGCPRRRSHRGTTLQYRTT